MSTRSPSENYARYRRALGAERMPAALVDLDALDANIEALLAPVRATPKTLRIGTKSIRCPDLIDYVVTKGGAAIRGLMTYSAEESLYLAGRGHRDLLLAYPTVQPADLAALVEANRLGASAGAMADCAAHVEALAAAAKRAGVNLPVFIDLDMGYRPLSFVHLGVRRSPLRDATSVVRLAEQIAGAGSLTFRGLMGYEAQIAGLTDANPFSSATNPIKRWIKRLSNPDVVRRRTACVTALRDAGLAPEIVNGGGSGSLGTSLADPSLTEVTAGSGFLDSLLFDYYRDLALTPAALFALQVVRQPAPDLVTCHGGGWVASGEAGPDKLPRPFLPAGLDLLPLEGAGEVQTPLRVMRGATPAIGDPVFFRHAKAGELAEHAAEYLLVRDDSVVARAATYRGIGRCFLG